MTVVCALRDPAPGGGWWLGSDSLCHNGQWGWPSEPKWYLAKSGLAIGVSGTALALQVLREASMLPSHLGELGRFVAAGLGALGCKPKYDDGAGAPNHGFSALVCDGRELWMLDCAGCHTAVREDWCAIGSGGQYADGAYFALRGGLNRIRGDMDQAVLELMHDKPSVVVYCTLAAACAYDDCCGGEPWVHLHKPALL